MCVWWLVALDDGTCFSLTFSAGCRKTIELGNAFAHPGSRRWYSTLPISQLWSTNLSSTVFTLFYPHRISYRGVNLKTLQYQYLTNCQPEARFQAMAAVPSCCRNFSVPQHLASSSTVTSLWKASAVKLFSRWRTASTVYVSNLLSETIAVLALISRPFPLRNVTCVELMFWSVTWWVQIPRNDK